MEYVSFHPQDNTSTIEFSKKDLLEFFTKLGLTYAYYDFEAAQPAQQVEVKVENETKLKIEYKKEDNFSNWYS